MNRSQIPLVVGIIDIFLAIVYGVLPHAGLLVNYIVSRPFDPSETSLVGHVTLFFLPFAIVGLPAGVLAIIGGIFAIKRRKWGLALAASIAILFPTMITLLYFGYSIQDAIYHNYYTPHQFILLILIITAILGIVLTFVSKKQFTTKSTNGTLETA
jgi:hypothetical protein